MGARSTRSLRPLVVALAWLIPVLSLAVMGDRGAAAGPRAERSRERIVPGVVLIREVLPGPVRLTALRLDLARVRVVPVLATDRIHGYTTLRALVGDRRPFAAVNGDFTIDGRPMHAVIHDGELLTSGSSYGAVLAFNRSGTHVAGRPAPGVWLERSATRERVRVRRWNAGMAPDGGIAAFTGAYGTPDWANARVCSVRLVPEVIGTIADGAYQVARLGCGPVPLWPGRGVVVTAPAAGPATLWLQALEPGEEVRIGVRTGVAGVVAAFGGFSLVREGEVRRWLTCDPTLCALHPRTGAGITSGCVDESPGTPCRILIVVVDGRRLDWSIGMTLPDFARAMRRLGAYEAINLDGGAPSQMILRGRTLNRPAPGATRAITSALLIEPRVAATGACSFPETRGPWLAGEGQWLRSWSGGPPWEGRGRCEGP